MSTRTLSASNLSRKRQNVSGFARAIYFVAAVATLAILTATAGCSDVTEPRPAIDCGPATSDRFTVPPRLVDSVAIHGTNPADRSYGAVVGYVELSFRGRCERLSDSLTIHTA